MAVSLNTHIMCTFEYAFILWPVHVAKMAVGNAHNSDLGLT